MKIYYPGPESETFHPKLGRLVKDKEFDLPREEADLYIKCGLLKKKVGSRQLSAGSLDTIPEDSGQTLN